CGIDFGTSNSTVGWLRPGVETLIALEDDKITLPSVVFFNIEERRPVYGRLALHEYLEGYEGRLIRAQKRLLGSEVNKHEPPMHAPEIP
ncbi:Hsp70 family protein, partial [Pseudomonas taetrolens]|uniref:Hsp70 family protein n=1 Tax=Pseudomonas taetrolens TaxID=47884 RepID=UPI003F95C517